MLASARNSGTRRRVTERARGILSRAANGKLVDIASAVVGGHRC
jgi:hypothetical protein